MDACASRAAETRVKAVHALACTIEHAEANFQNAVGDSQVRRRLPLTLTATAMCDPFALPSDSFLLPQAREANRVHHQIGKLLAFLRSNETAYGAILQVIVRRESNRSPSDLTVLQTL